MDDLDLVRERGVVVLELVAAEAEAEAEVGVGAVVVVVVVVVVWRVLASWQSASAGRKRLMAM